MASSCPGRTEKGPRQTESMDHWPADDPEYVGRFWELGPRSVFGGVQGADLAVSVAAAIQRLRGERRQTDGTWQESDLDEIFHSPLAKVLDPSLYLAGRYYEPVIVASILRASKRHDIGAPGDDFNLHEQVNILVTTEELKGSPRRVGTGIRIKSTAPRFVLCTLAGPPRYSGLCASSFR